jgi:hypothetical protein
MQVLKKTVYEVEDFDLIFEPIEDSISIKQTAEGFEVRYITYDMNPDNPFENQDGMGNFYHWDNSKELDKYCELLGYDKDTREKISKENKDAVRIDKYEHSGISYSVSGEGRNCQWDTSNTWAVWYPDKCLLYELKNLKGQTRRKKCIEYARQACELFNQWANGEVYCIVKETFNHNKESLDYDIVGGYFGRESAEEAIKTDF